MNHNRLTFSVNLEFKHTTTFIPNTTSGFSLPLFHHSSTNTNKILFFPSSLPLSHSKNQHEFSLKVLNFNEFTKLRFFCDFFLVQKFLFPFLVCTFKCSQFQFRSSFALFYSPQNRYSSFFSLLFIKAVFSLLKPALQHYRKRTLLLFICPFLASSSSLFSTFSLSFLSPVFIFCFISSFCTFFFFF